MNLPPNLPCRKTMDLTKGRISVPHARYFITVCLQRPATGLTEPVVGPVLNKMIQAVFAPPDAFPLCATIMPDHVHVLIELGTRLSIGRLVAKFKMHTRRCLPADTAWQRNFHEHRLRPDEPANDVARYIFLNPYRKRLIPPDKSWPLWLLGPRADVDFLHQLNSMGCPPRQWLDEPVPSFLSSLGSRRGSVC